MKTILVSLLFVSGILSAQQDTLKGSNTEFRNFWDVKKYEITIEPTFGEQAISGTNKITFEIIKEVTNPVFQIDLQQPMNYKIIDSDEKLCSSKRDGDFIFIETNKEYKKGEVHSFTIQFFGNPTVAKNAPWDGGWVFKKDDHGNPWMSVAQEGIGAAVGLPSKDIWREERDDCMISYSIAPKDLVGVGNGRLISQTTEKNKNIYTWEVKNPINLYSIVPNGGKYVNFKEII